MTGAAVTRTSRSMQAICPDCSWEGPKRPGVSPRSFQQASDDRDAHNQERHPAAGEPPAAD